MGIFNRKIYFEMSEGAEGTLTIIGTLRDERLKIPVHSMRVRAEIGLTDGCIISLEGEMTHVPHEDCRHALDLLTRLVGTRIEPGFTQLVREVVGSPDGCSHLAILVTNLGHASVQGRGALIMHSFGGDEKALHLLREQALQLGIMGNCYTWRKDGPLMMRIREQRAKESLKEHGERHSGDL